MDETVGYRRWQKAPSLSSAGVQWKRSRGWTLDRWSTLQTCQRYKVNLLNRSVDSMFHKRVEEEEESFHISLNAAHV